MIFAFSNKSVQKIEDSQTKGMQTLEVNNSSMFKPSGAPEKIEYVGKLNIGAINERAFDDLTGASYVSDIFNGYSVESQCQFVASMAGWTFGTIAGAVTSFFVPVAAPAVTWIAKTTASTIMRGECRDSLGSDQSTNSSSPDNGSGGNQGDPMEQGSFGIEDPNNSDGNNNGNEDGNTDSDTDTTSDDNDNGDDANDNGDDANDNDNDNSEGDSCSRESITGGEDTDAEAGGDDSNPNPEADGSQGSTSKPTIGPAPGDIGGRYDSVVNPGAERGFTPGNDDDGDGYGNPGNPWDRNERMSTPNGDGDPIDPLTGFGGPSDPEGNDGSPDDPDGEFNSSGPGDDLWKPNPDDIWGGGPNSQSFEGNTIEKIFEFAGTQSFDSTSDFQEKDLMIASMSLDTFGL